MNYARLNFLQLDRLAQARLSWGGLCYEIARDGGACVHFENTAHRRLATFLRNAGDQAELAAAATAIARALDAGEEAEPISLQIESMMDAARVLSPVAVKSISSDLGGIDDRHLQSLFDRQDGGAQSWSQAFADLTDFYRRASTRGQYVLLAEMNG